MTVVSVIQCHESQCGARAEVPGIHLHCPRCAGGNVETVSIRSEEE